VKLKIVKFAKIVIGMLMAIFALYAGYTLIGLSLAFGPADWIRLTGFLAALSVLLLLGVWMVRSGARRRI